MSIDNSANEKSGTLTLKLKADSGYESDEQHRISTNQWEKIQRVIRGFDVTSAQSDSELRAIWRNAGGNFHGPNIETGTMPESKLLPFLRELNDRQRERETCVTFIIECGNQFRDGSEARRLLHELAASTRNLPMGAA